MTHERLETCLHSPPLEGLAGSEVYRLQCAAKKDPLKQISLFSVILYFNILLRDFKRLFWTQFAIIVANFIISTFVVQK